MLGAEGEASGSSPPLIRRIFCPTSASTNHTASRPLPCRFRACVNVDCVCFTPTAAVGTASGAVFGDSDPLPSPAHDDLGTSGAASLNNNSTPPRNAPWAVLFFTTRYQSYTMSSRIESYELRDYRNKHGPQDDLPPPYTPYPHGLSRSTLFFGLYLVIPGLIVASAIALGFKSSVAAQSTRHARPGQWLDEEGVSMAQWPSTLFPNQDELPLAVAALALATAVLVSALLLIVRRGGPLQVRNLPPLVLGGG